MQFADLKMLHLTWLLLGFIIFLYWSVGYRRQMMERFAQQSLLKDVAASFLKRRVFWKNVLIVWIFLFTILALCRPQWGFEWQEVKREGIDLLVLVDTSKSMLTSDVKPNRLERTKLAVKDLLKKLTGDRIGLIAFAGEAFLVCPLTVDYNGFLLSLNDLSVDTVPRGGTNISKAIYKALEGYQVSQGQFKAIIIVTDGDNLEDDPVQAELSSACFYVGPLG